MASIFTIHGCKHGDQEGNRFVIAAMTSGESPAFVV